MVERRRKRGKSIAKLTRLLHSGTPAVRIFSVVDYQKTYWQGIRGLSPRSVRCELARHVRQCNTPSIERQYEAAYLSLFLLLSRAHFYERIHQPDYRWSLYSAYGIFLSLSPSLLLSILPTVFLISHSSYSFPPSRQARFSSERRKSRDARFRSKSKSLSTVPNIFTLDVVSTIPDRHRLRVLLDDVEIALLDVAVKQNMLS